jgi:hypothetical protein
MNYKWKYLFNKLFKTTAEFDSSEFALDEAEIALTKSSDKCADLFEINLLDYLIITKIGFYSFSNKGKLS